MHLGGHRVCSADDLYDTTVGGTCGRGRDMRESHHGARRPQQPTVRAQEHPRRMYDNGAHDVVCPLRATARTDGCHAEPLCPAARLDAKPPVSSKRSAPSDQAAHLRRRAYSPDAERESM
ncbi:hypothetical protein WOLCODRAFT_159246 [Wolfiporia cocos MD-104 SS10]|uniref:Uncharacterized protein n=1 Tax=Wolfiporia cocos (strain MD-104) TaxID=742152 RepID=A0A2H3JBN3_WOLCO|nr:hypothetical protein WOLCODRAFT_159246 [Wolfiporia cocos MD-104 SS10]